MHTIKLASASKLLCILSIFFLHACSSNTPAPLLSTLSIDNAGRFELPSPQVCYQSLDAQDVFDECRAINNLINSIPTKEKASFGIQANNTARIVLPYDSLHRSNGKVYRPNCHILIDLYIDAQKTYVIKSAIAPYQNQAEKGYNCSASVFMYEADSETLKDISDSVKQSIRYNIPRDGEFPANYIHNKDWQHKS